MARNPKPVRRRYRRIQAQVRRGTYPYAAPTYDQLNSRKFASTAYRVSVTLSHLARTIGPSVQRAAATATNAFHAGLATITAARNQSREDFGLVE